MKRTSRAAAGVTGLALFTLSLLATAAVADTTERRTKAQVEHAERSAAGPSHPTKAQIEQRERAELPTGGEQQRAPSPTGGSAGSGDSGAAAWQLTLSAALGATVTGGVVLASRQVSHHRHAVAH
jgi:hypothetical protein